MNDRNILFCASLDGFFIHYIMYLSPFAIFSPLSNFVLTDSVSAIHTKTTSIISMIFYYSLSSLKALKHLIEWELSMFLKALAFLNANIHSTNIVESIQLKHWRSQAHCKMNTKDEKLSHPELNQFSLK